ncbi:DUF4905 domain-containing protein [Flammeovirga sp. SubArs3]|uniref:DUF4905 domain-containing protein n=1 Tax=Flammeovirga sp. SubArs3 TaxID=2995316 RepID=UPI00248CEE45|nr:DUF4905 domain-containing protein [Flammeovirga sp. SubArs3]
MQTTKYNFEAHGQVWRVMYDESISTLLVEMRDPEKKEVSFAALNLYSGDVLWEGLQMDESWWVTMAGVKDGMLYFTHFAPDNRMPTVQKLQKLDILQALIIEDNVEDPKDISSAKDVSSPVIYPIDSEHHATLKKFLESKDIQVADSDIHYMETTSEIIFAYLVKNEEKLQRKILICDVEGNIIFKDAMDSVVNEQIMDSFFVIDKMLLYIKEKEILCGLPLDKTI